MTAGPDPFQVRAPLAAVPAQEGPLLAGEAGAEPPARVHQRFQMSKGWVPTRALKVPEAWPQSEPAWAWRRNP